ncbi:putative secreted protein (Por secretion system target) [Winogradskyella eximia]|uniref:Putative secreted protein (Por secretion system target) n=1 Tax=Winogradskyella eximia TaxID=262006 RepID=A0A3D9HC37_9FLAO|nr:lamin tail domain-containing protein [Winogradskyella eximia]RED47049.1 putative secreted protein (Por secretion system target) [Winogradskyella eximia]
MKNFYTLLFTLMITSFGFSQTLSPGDLAIIGLSVDDEEVLIVALEDIPSGESVFFTDEEWGGTSFNSGEGFYEWITPAITAGTVFTIDTSGTSVGGTVSQKAGSFALGNSGDGFYLYQTSTNIYNSGTYTILGFAGEDGGDAGTLTGTGLTIGTNAIYYGGDNGIYIGTRIGQDKATYLSLIYDSANWATSGSSQTFDLTNFTFTGACTPPTTQATAYNTTAIGTASATLNWTSGNGDEVLVLIKEGSAVDTDPSNGTTYTGNTVFTSGDQIGTGNYVVQSGSATSSVNVTGLNPATSYYVAIYEYNTTDTCYELTELTGIFTTDCSTPTDVTAFTVISGNTTIDLSWTNEACFDEVLIVAKATSAVTVTPTGDGSAYTADANFGSGTDLGSGEFTVYKGTGTTVTVTGLTNGTTYHFTIFTRKNTTWSTGVTNNIAPSTAPVAGDIVISEIMYNSSGTDDEWIEIYNASLTDINLDSDWRLVYGGSTYDFTGITITSGSYLTIALGSNGDGTFNNDNPFTPDVSVISTPATTASTDDSNNLVNSSTTIAIILEPSGSNVTIDTVTYDDGSPWPTTPDGNGPSLELVDVTSDNSLAASWDASDIDGGTPGTGYILTYTYAGSWSPSNPNGTATAADNIVIASGTATIDTNTTANLVTVNPGAALTVDTGIILTITNDLVLESISTSYSSLILDGTIAGTVTYNRYVNSNNSVNGNDLISAPLSGQAFNTFIANNPNIRANPSGPEVLFGGFDNDSSTNPFELWNDTDTTPLTAGKGYRSGITEGEASNLVTFEGTVSTGLVQTVINQGTVSKLNLIGNPFPSYLDAQQFLSHNASLLDPSALVIYGYNDSTDGTSAGDYTIISALLNTSMNIAPGQGFFVASGATGGNIEFTTTSSDMRLAAGGDDFIAGRDSSVISNLKLNLSNANANFITDIFFTEFSTLGLDPGYDASLLGGSAPSFALYSELIEDNTGVPFAVQALGKTDYLDVTIPLGVNANQGEQITFSINETNLPSTIDIYLDDTVENTSTLLNTSDYVMTPITNLSGVGRFYLRFSESTLSTSNHSLNNISIYTNANDKTAIIAGQLLENTTAYIYDIQGRVVSTTTLNSTSSLQSLDTSHLTAGIYVIQLTNGTQNKTQKVIIH